MIKAVVQLIDAHRPTFVACVRVEEVSSHDKKPGQSQGEAKGSLGPP